MSTGAKKRGKKGTGRAGTTVVMHGFFCSKKGTFVEKCPYPPSDCCRKAGRK